MRRFSVSFGLEGRQKFATPFAERSRRGGGGIIPTERDREYDEAAKLATSTSCPQRLFR